MSRKVIYLDENSSITNNNIVQLTGTQTLRDKTLTSPIINNMLNSNKTC